MALIRNLFILFTITLFSVASMFLGLYNYNPYDASPSQYLNFYISFFFTVSGISSLTYYFVKIKLNKEKVIYSPFWPSVRRGLLSGLCLTTLLFLKGVRLLDWWVGISALIILALIELFFQTKRPSVKTHK